MIEIFAPQKSEKNESVSVSNVRQLSPPPPPSTDNTVNTGAEAEQTKRDFETIHLQLEVGYIMTSGGYTVLYCTVYCTIHIQLEVGYIIT